MLSEPALLSIGWQSIQLLFYHHVNVPRITGSCDVVALLAIANETLYGMLELHDQPWKGVTCDANTA